ncbi:hypothetical protein BHE74_00017175 [Ensete ventricosum]|nr:hypothetical protein BHE74_00017175 [Ensete ventricosum]
MQERWDVGYASLVGCGGSVEGHSLLLDKYCRNGRLYLNAFLATPAYLCLATFSKEFSALLFGNQLFVVIVNLASLEKGVREGRLLIHDWLVILLSQYHDAYKLVRYENGSSTSNIDVAFTQCPQLQSLPRLVFALLRSPLLRFHEEGQERSITPKLMFIRGGHDDATAFENHLMEDKDVDGTGLPSVTGFFTFLEEIASDVSENIK